MSMTCDCKRCDGTGLVHNSSPVRGTCPACQGTGDANRQPAMGAGVLSDVDILAQWEITKDQGKFHSMALPTDAAIIAFARDILPARPTASGAGDLSDAARLDWLVDERATIQETQSGARKLHCVYWPDLEEWQNAYFETPRAAIDAAMQARPTANGAGGQKGGEPC